MNSKFLEKIIAFREKRGLETTKTILAKKIHFQFGILYKTPLARLYIQDMNKVKDIQEAMLLEARAAKTYWKIYGEKLTGKIEWYSRKPHKGDVCNKYIDIGYHYLLQKIEKMFIEIELPPNIGFFHKAQSKKSLPLVYDFMEWIRSIAVDKVLINLFRKKKVKVVNFKKETVGLFLSKIKNEFDKHYFHRDLKYGITLDYWIHLTLLDLQKSVNQNKKFDPVFPSLRHETRCNSNKKTPLCGEL